MSFKEWIDNKNGGRLLYISSFIDKINREFKFIITKQFKQGITSASSTYNALMLYNPDIVVFVGIAGSLQKEEQKDGKNNILKVKIGDVFIPTSIIDTTLKSQTNGEIQLRAGAYTINSRLRGALQLLTVQSNKFKISENPFISDNIVLKDIESEIVKAVKKFNDKTAGVEMEAAGLFNADYESAKKAELGVLIFRGISDYADDQKNQIDSQGKTENERQKLASDNAAIAFSKFIEILKNSEDIR